MVIPVLFVNLIGFFEAINIFSTANSILLRPIFGFLLFFLLSWIGISIIKKILNKLVFKSESVYIRHMGESFLAAMFLCAGRIALLQFGLAFGFSVSRTVLSIFDSFIILFFSLAVINFTEKLIIHASGNIKSAQIKESTVALIRRIIVGILVFLCITLILKVWGIEIGPLLTGLGIAGVAIGLALQTTLGDVFSGMAIAFDKEFQVGDVIEFGDVFGVVKEISGRSVKVKTYGNDIVIIANSKFGTGNLINHTMLKPRRAMIVLRLVYGTDVEKVKELCTKAIEKSAIELKKEKGREIILSEPRSYAYMSELAEYSVNFKVFIWCPSFDDLFDGEERVKREIYNSFKKEGIKFAQPNQMLPAKESA